MKIVLSFPLPRLQQDASFVPYSDHKFNQVILGFESQIHALLPFFTSISSDIYICAVPELFFALEGLDTTSGEGRDPIFAQNDVLHLRFGPLRLATLLKGARNVAVVAEQECRSVFASGMNPFVVGDVLPADFKEVVLLSDAPSGLCRPDGSRIAEHVLGSDFGGTASWSHISAREEETSNLKWLLDVEAMSAASFEPHAWGTRRRLDWYPPRQQSFEKLAMEQINLVEGRRPLTLLPWNMSDPGPFVEDIVDAFLAETQAYDLGIALAILPFNETSDTNARLGAIVERTRRHPRHESLLNDELFFVSIKSGSTFPYLRTLFPSCILNVEDPEFAWSFRRLSSLGSKLFVFGAEDLEEIGISELSNLAIDFFPFETSDVLVHNTFFGSLHVESGRVSRRQFRALAGCVRECANREPADNRIIPLRTLQKDPEEILQKVLRGR